MLSVAAFFLGGGGVFFFGSAVRLLVVVVGDLAAVVLTDWLLFVAVAAFFLGGVFFFGSAARLLVVVGVGGDPAAVVLADWLLFVAAFFLGGGGVFFFGAAARLLVVAVAGVDVAVAEVVPRETLVVVVDCTGRLLRGAVLLCAIRVLLRGVDLGDTVKFELLLLFVFTTKFSFPFFHSCWDSGPIKNAIFVDCNIYIFLLSSFRNQHT